MIFTDTHTHLYDEAFTEDADAAVERAVQAGVTRLILPDIDSASREDMFALADRHEDVLFPCLGLHPTSIGTGWEEEISDVERLLGSRKIWAMR